MEGLYGLGYRRMTHPDTAPSVRWHEVTIPVRELVGRVGRWIIGTIVIVALPFGVVNGWTSLIPPPLGAVFLGDVAIGVLILIGVYTLSIPVHEGLHALGMIVTGTPASAISFGAKLRQGIVYIHCDRPMSLRSYRFTLLLPVAVTGVLPAVVSVAVGSQWIAVYSALMIVSAVGDMEMVWRLRRLPGETLVRDHPDELGCEIQLVREVEGAES
ncbi:MAG: DUF3267 domain-containing protein [Rhodothermia bacterium]|nr:DUF3267 domain-containing protein [Rhodothermia bacterium]